MRPYFCNKECTEALVELQDVHIVICYVPLVSQIDYRITDILNRLIP
ncbi:MAG: hypothetical protein ACE1Z6_05895 [Candidatus Methylomirabilales bacterium]